ncbi:MAG: c-type cytochrome [Bdellovibrionia bacterium]
MKAIFSTTLVLTVAAALTACGPSGNKPNVELIQDMMESPAIKAQEFDAGSPDNRGMRVPPTGTVPVGFEPYKFKGNVEGAKQNPNPLSGDMDPETLYVGQKYYNTNCALCHGLKGEGGEAAGLSVSAKMALKPPSVISEKIIGWTDGHIYHVITDGQGVMGPYNHHIPQKYRWQVVNYIRFLQQEAGK